MVLRTKISSNVLKAVLILAFVGFIFFGFQIHFERKRLNEQALIHQLKNLRSSISTYLMIVRQPPPDLKSLMESPVQLQERLLHPSLQGFKRDQEGKPIDVFGNPFAYDIKGPWVRSATPGYETW